MDFNIQILTWVMTSIGFSGFIFAGRKEWWAWYINMACQILWAIYALATGQPAFLVFAAAYFVIFARNAYLWTKDHRDAKKIWALKPGESSEFGRGTTVTMLSNIEPGFKFPTDGQPDIELIARTCHEANRVLQLSSDDENPSYPWHLASDEQKKSAIEGVKVALEGATAEELHESWSRQKLADGWVYGPFKDEGIKTHPCLVPYSELPEKQQLKDHMFRAIVKSFKLHKQYANVPQG
jgi:hypothetical protein